MYFLGRIEITILINVDPGNTKLGATTGCEHVS